MRIHTPRLELISCDRDLLRILIADKGIFEKMLNLKIPQRYTEYGLSHLHNAMEKLNDTKELGWWTYLPIIIETNTLIGTCGYKGKPDKEGVVEIHYEIIEPLRNKGYAKEIAKALIENAFTFDKVKIVRAHTLALENASAKVLKSSNMKFVDKAFDPEDGKVWRWEIESNQSRVSI